MSSRPKRFSPVQDRTAEGIETPNHAASLSLSGPPVDAVKAALGKSSFGLCAACHGPTGEGNHAMGAPNLTDNIWLHGNSLAQIEKVIREGTGGVMPAWRDRLGEDNVRMIGAWLHARAAGTGGSGR